MSFQACAAGYLVSFPTPALFKLFYVTAH